MDSVIPGPDTLLKKFDIYMRIFADCKLNLLSAPRHQGIIMTALLYLDESIAQSESLDSLGQEQYNG